MKNHLRSIFRSAAKAIYRSPLISPIRRVLTRLLRQVIRTELEATLAVRDTHFTRAACFQEFEKAVQYFPAKHSEGLRAFSPFVFDCLLSKVGVFHAELLTLYSELRSLNHRHPRALLDESSNTGNRKLKILFVTACFPSLEHGGGLRVFDIIYELALKGHEVSLYSIYHEARDATSFALLKEKLKNCRLVPFSDFRNEDFHSWLKRTGENYDSGHYIWPHAGELIAGAKKHVKTSVFELIESTSRRSLIDLELSIRQKDCANIGKFAQELYWNWTKEKKAIDASERVIALTSIDAEFSSGLFAVTNIDIVPTGVSRVAILNRIPVKNGIEAGQPSRGPFSAVFIGNYNHYPNKDGVLWFLKNIHQKVLSHLPEFKIAVAGIGDISEIKNEFGNDASIEFLGEVSDVVTTLQSAKICLAPLITGAGLRGKVIQYSEVGRPTVSTSIGSCGMPYVHGDSILIADDPSEFANHVIRLLTDADLYKNMTAAAKAINAKHYSWDQSIQKLERIYAG